MKPILTKRKYIPFTGNAIAVIIFLLSCCPLNAQVDEDYQTDNDEKEQPYFFGRREGNEPVLYHRDIPDSKVKQLKESDAFWYADKDFKKEKKDTESDPMGEPYVPLGQRVWFQTLLWLFIIGAFAGVLIWFLAENKIGLFNKKSNAITAGEGEEISEDIFAINYQKEIDKALQQGNYRLAVRLMFLRLLRNMSEKNVINYKQDKTNFDYLLELQPTTYYNNFFRIARNYEYSWYGQFDVNPDTYQLIKKDFDQFDRLLYKL